MKRSAVFLPAFGFVHNIRASTSVYRRSAVSFGESSGDVYEQAVVKAVAGFFRGNSTPLFGVTRLGAPGVYVRTGSSHLNEVVWPQSPRTEPG